ncbi:hypothetical protein TRIUR3_13824 [Triticum urartu]|uniref:Uncharacterized protein n=1 Tax=Triticum urartu TaxID=4572 RepID=M7ZJ85_TRIUA|nr:hypothetical protein TRIUR3_13824 [Triticum urartu]
MAARGSARRGAVVLCWARGCSRGPAPWCWHRVRVSLVVDGGDSLAQQEGGAGGCRPWGLCAAQRFGSARIRRHHLGESALLQFARISSSLGTVEVGAAAPDGFWIVCRDGDLGNNGCRLGRCAQRRRSDFTSGRRPRMWCDVHGLQAVVLSSVGRGQLGCAAFLLEGSGGMSGRRPRKAVPVDCAGRGRAMDVGAAAPRESL